MKPKNIIILHADQHRSDCLGCYGNKDIHTPNIDALASDGVRYTNHFTVYPVCTPSRYSLLSGLYTHQHSAWTNLSTLPSGFPTFPKILAENGFNTSTVGKCHFTPTYLNVGYQNMILSEQNGEGRFEDDYHTFLKDNDLIDAIDLTDQVDEHRQTAPRPYYDHFGAFESDLPKEYHSTSWITQQAITQINGWTSDSNNLLFVGYIKPHHPFDPPYPYSEMYDPNKLTIPEGYTDSVPDYDYENGHGFFDNKTLSEEKLRRITANYYGNISHIDDGIGEIIALLKEKNMYDDSLIIYTSDHGEYLGYHHMLLKCNFLYEPLAKIPLIIKFPNNEFKNTVNDNLSENIDISTTILNSCELPVPTSMDGIDLHNQNIGRDYAFSEGHYGDDITPRFNYMIRTKDYKLIINGSLNNCMFFDLKNDKYELHNEFNNPKYSNQIATLKSYAIDKMMFSGCAKNHCDIDAPQMRIQSELDRKADALKDFISTKISELYK